MNNDPPPAALDWDPCWPGCRYDQQVVAGLDWPSWSSSVRGRALLDDPALIDSASLETAGCCC